MALLPTASFPSFRPTIAELTRRGNRKVCFMKAKTSPATNSMDRSPLQRGFLVTALALTCLAVGPQARATCVEGCLTNNNTALGDGALVNDTTGGDNIAIGVEALFANTTGTYNTATGFGALEFNRAGSSNTATGLQALFFNAT